MDLDFTASFRNLLQYITQILPDISFHKEYQCVIASIPPSLASHSSLARSIYGYILSLSTYRELTSLHIRYLLPTLWFSGNQFSTIKDLLDRCYADISLATAQLPGNPVIARLQQIEPVSLQMKCHLEHHAAMVLF